MKYDIGCGPYKKPGFIGVDRVQLPGVDVVHDLSTLPWPLPDNAASEINMVNVIEHLPDTVGVFNELHRIAALGCRVEIIYPYFRSAGAYGDPTHVRYFSEYMIDYFLRPGTSSRRENGYAFYTDRYWRLLERQLIGYPGVRHLPDHLVSVVSRHLLNLIHVVRIVITPDKP